MSRDRPPARAQRWRRRLVAGVLAAAFFAGAGAVLPAAAYWSVRHELVGTAVADVQYPAPTNVQCINQGGLLSRYAQLYWNAVADADGYRVVAVQPNGATRSVDVIFPTIALTGGILSDLLNGLLGSGDVQVLIYPFYRYGSNDPWVGDAASGWMVRATILPLGTTCSGPLP